MNKILNKKQFLFGFLIVLITVALDQGSKWWIMEILYERQAAPITILPFFNLVMVWNPGVSFGMLQTLSYGHIILSAAALIIISVLFAWMWKSPGRATNLALGLIIGGAMGNIIDRIRFGAVADFFDFHLANWHWPAFNIADSAVFIGACILIYLSLLGKEK